ncbi:MAG TPA: M1 family aminopeptidase [Vicinamibacterales bacterium]|nr:M1 family aminopeptidase [Vicinamibacterales bacterium]
MTSVLVALFVLLSSGTALGGSHASVAAVRQDPPSAHDEGLARLLQQLENALQAGREDALESVLAPGFDRTELPEFRSGWYSTGITRAVVRERDRVADGSNAFRLVLEVLVEYEQTGRMLTWQACVVETEGRWLFESLDKVSSLEGLHKLELDATRQFQARDLRVSAQDFELVLPRGDVFLCRVPTGVTCLVIVGRGEMIFRPAPETEQRQLEIFGGDPQLRTPFTAAFVRIHPAEYGTRLSEDALTETAVVPRTLSMAQQVFRIESAKSFAVDLGELSREAWSLLPPYGDFLAEVRTTRFGTLTYVHTSDEPEDISLFDRAKRHNISVYASRERLAERGPYFHEDDEAVYDVLDYSVDATITPERLWFDARSSIRLRTNAEYASTLTLRLHNALAVRAVTSEQYGRLLFVRIKNQNALVVSLPRTVSRGSELTLTVVYSGRLEPQAPETEAGGQVVVEAPFGPPSDIEPSYVYSNRSYWYPQSSVTDYATSTIRVTLPIEYGAVCTGVPASGSPVTLRQPTERRIFVFTSSLPVRYLGCAIARFTHSVSTTVQVPSIPGSPTASTGPQQLRLAVETTMRMRPRARELLPELEQIVRFYAEIMQEAPYPLLSLAVLESRMPGGHSPPYVAAYHQTLPGVTPTWRNDPSSFENYPEFFLAHEVAHQWWGHAIGWQNYHEQWLSEGFAQYFAALYAERRRGLAVFDGIIRRMHDWAVRESAEGPVYLGYRLGHVKGDPRVFRALVYNKGAMVLHMLRRLVGDDVFFRALRRFFREHRFTKSGTEAVRLAFEQESGRDLSRFFERWIYGWSLPSISHTSRVENSAEGSVVVLQFTQREPVFDVPITVTLRFRNADDQTIVVPVTDKVVERRIPITAALRDVRINEDRAALLAR